MAWSDAARAAAAEARRRRFHSIDVRAKMPGASATRRFAYLKDKKVTGGGIMAGEYQHLRAKGAPRRVALNMATREVMKLLGRRK
jgi:hypothetical protein